jgi:tRNA (uracil-5-)-methyltransferase TRM9
MDDRIASKLVSLNSEFYQTFASHFAATRMRLQPGVVKILADLPMDADILDLGCGNGELAGTLAHRGHRGRYLGFDFSPELIDIAREKLEAYASYTFIDGDLAAQDWALPVREYADTELGKSSFDVIFAFATLHHLPGHDLHKKTLCKIHTLLHQEGSFIHSNWQFLNSQRLRERIQPWEMIGITSEDVDHGDYLLDWRHGGHGLRYVHHFDEGELGRLAVETGFTVIDSFFSDGEGGNLGLYQVWKKAIHAP